MNSTSTHFLIIRLSSIGDILHATTVAHNLKKELPDCHITWLASPPASELLVNNPDIDQLLVWDRNAFEKALFGFHLKAIIKSIQQLRHFFQKNMFDVVLDIHGLFLTGIIAWMTHAPRRIGIRVRHEHNDLFMTELAPDVNDPHIIRHYMSALAPLGIHTFDPHLILKVPASLDHFSTVFWRNHTIDPDRPILMVTPRTTWPDKNWPLENFAAALTDLPQEVQLVFCGTPNDRSSIEKIQAELPSPSISIAGETSLLELAALFRTATLLLTGDTGPLHIAVAVGLPTLSLWGATYPAVYGPLYGPHTFLLSPHDCVNCCKTHCRYKTNACMEALSPESVREKLHGLLA